MLAIYKKGFARCLSRNVRLGGERFCSVCDRVVFHGALSVGRVWRNLAMC